MCWETVLSGPGLVNVYRAVSSIWGSKAEALSPAEISTAGMAMSDPVCHQTLETFAGLLGSAAANFLPQSVPAVASILAADWWRNCRAFSRPAHCVGALTSGVIFLPMFRQSPCI